MTISKNRIAFVVTLLILFFLGVWQTSQGEIGFGSSLIGATIGVAVIRYIKQKKIREMQAKGLNPYDERIIFISDKASRLTLSISIVLAAFFVLAGSVFGPNVQVNPYNFLGFCIAILIFIYLICYYHYGKSN
jgi:uncharacterized membrane protein